MATTLTIAQRQALTAALAVARANTRTLNATSPSPQWTAVLKALATAITSIPGAEDIIIQDKVCSFANTKKKEGYYKAQQPADPTQAAQAAADKAENTTVSVAAAACRADKWNLFLSCSETGDLGQANQWHCVGVVYYAHHWTLFTSETNVPATATAVRRADAAGHLVPLEAVRKRYPAHLKDGTVQLAQRQQTGPFGQAD